MLEELVSVVAIVCVIGLPMFGIVARFALRPLVQDFARAIRGASEDELNELHERLALLEERLDQQERAVNRVTEADRFHRELRAGS